MFPLLFCPEKSGPLGQACPELRESEFYDSALEFGVLNLKYKNTNSKPVPAGP